MAMDASTISAWKQAALKPDTDAPVPTHTLDQILAAARDAELSEREQGVLLMTMALGDLERKLVARGQSESVPLHRKMAVASSMVLRMLEKT